MPTIAPWLQAPDFLGASEAGARLGLSRAQMLQQAGEHAAELALRADELATHANQANAERQQQQQQFSAANALRQEAEKNDLMLGTQRNQSYADSVSARDALEQSKIDAMKGHNQFFNTGGGLFKIGLDGKPSLVEGTSKPNPEDFQTVAEKIPATVDEPADVNTHWFHNLMPWNDKLSPTTNSPAITGHGEQTVTRKIPTTADLPSPAAAALRQPAAEVELPDFGTPAGLTPAQSAAKANEIAAMNPSLSRDEIIRMINKL